MAQQHFTLSTELPVPAARLRDTLSMAGVNAELWPLLRMTVPDAWARLPITQWPTERQLFHSWILLLGLLPVDRHAFRFEATGPDGFAERSSSLINARWQHQRRIDALPAGCRLSDQVHYRSRLPLLGACLRPLYRAVFAWRHRRLRHRYGRR